MKLVQRLSRLGTETAFEVLAEVERLRAQGRNIIALSIGEPAGDTAAHIKDAAKEALDKNMTHYGPSAGLMPFRKVIAESVAASRGIPVAPEEVVVVPGGKPVIFFSLLALIEEGDEVLYPNPGYPIYESMINFTGGRAVPLRLREERGFSFDVKDLRSKITSRTKLVIINSPQNPTGGIVPREDLEEVARLAAKHDFWVLSDEIYSRMVYDGKFESISQFPGMKERMIILDGHSKTYAMTGWRVGYGVFPKVLAPHIAKLMTNSNSCTATFTQYAGMKAMTSSQDCVDTMVGEFRERRDFIVKGLNAIDGFSCRTPAGAFYAYPNVTKVCRQLGFQDSKALQQFLLHKAGVAVLGQHCFGTRQPDEDQEYIRLSYVSSLEDLREALKRIAAALRDRRLVEEFLNEERARLATA